MNILIGFLLTLQIIICVLLVTVVLMQRSKSDGLAGGAAFGGDFTGAFFGAGTARVLVKITAWLGGLFFAISLLLAVLYSIKYHGSHGGLKKILSKEPAASTNNVKSAASTNAPSSASTNAPAK